MWHPEGRAFSTPPLTAFEALAAGKPIVATDADGLMDVLTDRRDARIVPRRDARALADAILELIDDPKQRTQLSAGARVTAGQYDITAFVRKMERLYEILAERMDKDIDEIRRDADRDFWLSAEDAVTYGAIDEVRQRGGV